jgi:hypothetical protein
MRPLKSHCRADALTTLETVLKQTKEARVFRRAQAVREVVAGQYVNAVSARFHLYQFCPEKVGPALCH